MTKRPLSTDAADAFATRIFEQVRHREDAADFAVCVMGRMAALLAFHFGQPEASSLVHAMADHITTTAPGTTAARVQ